MSLEIYVAGDIEKALGRLKQSYKRDFAQDVVRHSYYLSPSRRRRLKKLKAIQRLRKLESRSMVRTNRAIMRGMRGERAFRVDYERVNPVKTF